MKKIVVISDTHNRLDQIQVPDGDILLHCGDATGRGTIQETSKFNHDLQSLPHPIKIFCPGNHDFLFEKNESLARSILTNATTIINETIEVDGIKIYGSPYQPAFMNWAFNLPRGPKLKAEWDNIPNDTDILITHGPAFGFGDLVPWDNVNAGCKDLLNRLQEIDCKFHLYGHIHSGYGKYKLNNTTLINASICDEAYNPINKPWVIEI